MKFNRRVTEPDFRALALDLRAADLTATAIADLLGAVAVDALERGNRLPAERALTEASPLATLVRAFRLGLPVAVADAEAALPQFTVAAAIAAGLFEERDGALWPEREITPYAVHDVHGDDHWWILSDLGEMARGAALSENHVLGVGGASRTLAGLLIPEPVDSALDLGTGCGIQALHLARWSRRVVATDISERALVLARANAQLNGVENIEFRLGNMFEPVAGERFDRIASNPPFVITPRVAGVPEYEYRDGGMAGDGIVRAMVEGVREHLTPGGIAQMLGNWEYHESGNGFDRLQAWVAGELDAWVVERETQGPARYAETWIRDGGTRPGTQRWNDLLGAWLDDFAERGVAAIGFGYVLLRSPDAEAEAPRWARYEHAQGGGGALGMHLAQVVAAHDWQVARSDAELLRESLQVSGDVTEERHYWPGSENPTAMLLRQGGGFARAISLDTGLAAIVGASDGTLGVGVLIAAIAELLEVDEAALAADLLPALRDLLDTGFLVPAEFAAVE